MLEWSINATTESALGVPRLADLCRTGLHVHKTRREANRCWISDENVSEQRQARQEPCSLSFGADCVADIGIRSVRCHAVASSRLDHEENAETGKSQAMTNLPICAQRSGRRSVLRG